jgi:hypothetical protein
MYGTLKFCSFIDKIRNMNELCVKSDVRVIVGKLCVARSLR